MEPSNGGDSREKTFDSNALGVELRDATLSPSPEAEEPRDDGKEARLAVQETARNTLIPRTPDRVHPSVLSGGSACLEREHCHPLHSSEHLAKKSSEAGEIETTRPVQEFNSDERVSQQAVIQKRIVDEVFQDKTSYQSQEAKMEDISIDPDTYPKQFQMGHYDVLIIYIKDDVVGAVKWRELLETRINVGKGKTLKVALIEQNEDGDYLSDEFPDIGSKFQITEEGMNRSTFTHLFMSKKFVENNFQQLQVENCIMESINNPTKKWSVIPIYTLRKKNANFKVPFAIMSLKGLDLSTFLEGRLLRDTVVQELKIEEKDRFFLSSLTKALKGRLSQREKREKQQQEELEKWIEGEKERLHQDAIKNRHIEEMAQRQKEINRENFGKALAEDKRRGLEDITKIKPHDIDTRRDWKIPEESRNPGLHHSQSYPSQYGHQIPEALLRSASWGTALPPGYCNGYQPPQYMYPPACYNPYLDPRFPPHLQPNPGQGFPQYNPMLEQYYQQMQFPQNPHQPSQIPQGQMPAGYMNHYNPYHPPPGGGGGVPNQAPSPHPASQPEAIRKRDSSGSETPDNVQSGPIYIRDSRVVIKKDTERVTCLPNPESSSSSETEYEIDYADPSTMGSRDPAGSPNRQNVQPETQTHLTSRGPLKSKRELNTASLPEESLRGNTRPAENTMSDRMSMRSRGNGGEGCKTKSSLEDGKGCETKGPPEEKLRPLNLPTQAVDSLSPQSPVFADCSPQPGTVDNPLNPAMEDNTQDSTDLSSHYTVCQQDNQETTYEKQPSGREDSVDGMYMQATVSVNNSQMSNVSGTEEARSLLNYFEMERVLPTPDEDCHKSKDDDDFEIIDPKELEEKTIPLGKHEIQNNSKLLPPSDNHGQQTSGLSSQLPQYTPTEDNGGGNRDENRLPSIPVEHPRDTHSYRSSDWAGSDIEVAELAEDLC